MTPAEAKRDVVIRSAAVVVALVTAGGAFALSPRLAELAGQSAVETFDVALANDAAARSALAEPVRAAWLASLMAPAPDAPQPFLPTGLRDAAAICAALSGAGFANSGWSRSSVAGGRWECYATAGEAVSATPFSVFYMLRGGAGQIDEMRLKVTLREAAAAPQLRARMTRFLEAFAASAQISFPPAFLASVRNGGWATFVSPHATYTFARETGAANNWNLSVAFADPTDIGRADGALSLPVKAVRGKRLVGIESPLALAAER